MEANKKEIEAKGNSKSLFHPRDENVKSPKCSKKLKLSKEFNSNVDLVIFRGNFVHSKSLSELEYLEDYHIGVKFTSSNNKRRGVIAFVEKSLENILKKDASWETAQIKNYLPSNSKGKNETQCHKTTFFIPGLIDTHTHAPQYPFLACGRIPLLQWLEKYTFPTESKFSDPQFALKAYEKVVRRHIMNGTTTCCYFGTIHLRGSLILADVVSKYGQRAYIGKVCMDQNSPDFYIESTDQSLEDTETFAKTLLALENDLLVPILTPRFAPTCSSELMKGLGEIAKRYDLPTQTHISENLDEIKWVAELFPSWKSYAKVYDQCGLLNNKTILAHAIYLEDNEIDLVKAKECGVSHCANSNFSIHSGILDVLKLLKKDIKVGLGTDISGGYSVSMLDSIRNTIIASKAMHFHKTGMLDGNNNNSDSNERTSVADEKQKMREFPEYIDFKEAFYLATLGGAKVINKENALGSFEVGKEFDAVFVDVKAANSNIDWFENDTFNDTFQKFIFNGDDRNIQEVYVSGNSIHNN